MEDERNMETLNNIENKYDIQNIYFNRYQVWPIVRMALFFQLRKRNNLQINNKKKIDKINLLTLLLNILDIKNLKAIINLIAGKKKFVLLSDSLELRNINGHSIDKIAYNLIDIINEEDVLIIENSYHARLPRNILYKSYLYQDLITLAFQIYTKIIYLKKTKIENERLIQEILIKLNISLNYKYIIAEFIASYKCYRMLFKIGNIKAIFVNCYYSFQNQAAVFAARELNLNVIELQHGVINKEHLAYNFSIPLEGKYFPNYLFAFGEYVRDILRESKYIKNQNILAVGNAYIDYIKDEYNPQAEIFDYFQSIRNKYDCIIGVSLQEIYEDETMEFISRAAMLDRCIYYILVPRIYKKHSGSQVNVEIININNSDLDIYKIIFSSDFHSTVNSTCALEAPALGVANIFINIDNKSREYYGNMLNPIYNRYANDPNEFVKIIKEWVPPNKEIIKSMHTEYFENDNRSKIIEALDRIGIQNQYK